jgi:hypothetical protein
MNKRNTTTEENRTQKELNRENEYVEHNNERKHEERVKQIDNK